MDIFLYYQPGCMNGSLKLQKKNRKHENRYKNYENGNNLNKILLRNSKYYDF